MLKQKESILLHLGPFTFPLLKMVIMLLLISIVMFNTTHSANISIDVSRKTSIQFTYSLTDGYTQAFVRVSISHPLPNQNPELTSEMNIQQYVTQKPIVYIFPNSVDPPSILDSNSIEWIIPDITLNPLSTYDLSFDCVTSTTASTKIVFQIIWPFRSSLETSLDQAKRMIPPSFMAIDDIPYTGLIDLPTMLHYTSQGGLNDVYEITFDGLDYILPKSRIEDWCLYFKHNEHDIYFESNDSWVTWTNFIAMDLTQGIICFDQPPIPFPPTLNIKLATIASTTNNLLTAFVKKIDITYITIDSKLLLPSRFLNSTDPLLIGSPIKISSIESIDHDNQGIDPFIGELPSLYRWKLEVLQTASSHSLNQLQQYIYEDERSIYFCVPTDSSGIFSSTSRTNDGLTINFSSAPLNPTSYLVDCYGSVSPFFKDRLNGPPLIEIDSQIPPELIPFYLNFSWSQLNSGPLDFILDYLPSRSMLPQIRAQSVPFSSLFVLDAKTFCFYKVTISVAGHTQDIGMNFSVPKGSQISHSHRGPLGQISTSYINPSSFNLSTFPSLPPMPDLFSHLFSCSIDTSSSVFDTFTCDILTTSQLNLNIEFFLRLPLDLNSFQTYPISGSIVKYHSDIPSNINTKPLQVYKVPLVFSPLPSSQPPVILVFLRSPTAGRTTIKFTLQAAIHPQPVRPNITPPRIILPSSHLGLQFSSGANPGTTRDAVKISYFYFEGNTPTLVYETIESDILPGQRNLASIPPTVSIPFQSAIMFVMITYITKPLDAPAIGSDDSDQWTYSYFYTEFFTIQASCHIAPSSIELTQWTTSCHNGGKCMSNPNANTYECICINGFSGPTCDIAPCARCMHHKIDECQKNTPGGKCVCETTWSGDLCDVPVACVDVSKNVCKNNGQINDLTPSKACDTTKPCHCVNLWSDATCSTCSLQCKNGGRVNAKQCVKCGCPASFTGETCECLGVNAQFTFNGYNDIVIDYLTALSSATAPLDNEDLVQKFDTIVFQVFQVIAELMNISTQSIIKFELSSVKTSLDTPPEASTTGSSTFKFQISFNCPLLNPDLSESELTTRFTKQLLPRVIQHDVIQRLFVFPTNAAGTGEEPTGTIDPVVETLEPIEESENGSIWYYHCMIMAFSLAFSFIFAL